MTVTLGEAIKISKRTGREFHRGEDWWLWNSVYQQFQRFVRGNWEFAGDERRPLWSANDIASTEWQVAPAPEMRVRDHG